MFPGPASSCIERSNSEEQAKSSRGEIPGARTFSLSNPRPVALLDSPYASGASRRLGPQAFLFKERRNTSILRRRKGGMWPVRARRFAEVVRIVPVRTTNPDSGFLRRHSRLKPFERQFHSFSFWQSYSLLSELAQGGMPTAASCISMLPYGLNE